MAGGAALGNGVSAVVRKQDGGGDSPGASASNPLASLLGYRCVPKYSTQLCSRVCQHVWVCSCRSTETAFAHFGTVSAAGSSNEEESGSESGDTDEREPAEPSSPAGKAASAASGDGMDAEVRSSVNCRRPWFMAGQAM